MKNKTNLIKKVKKCDKLNRKQMNAYGTGRRDIMGIYLNPGNRGFWQSIRSEIYVDKTGLIAKTNQYLNTEQQYICVSRPRRFGKSMALKMPAAYYSRGCDSGELFKGF